MTSLKRSGRREVAISLESSPEVLLAMGQHWRFY